MSIRRVHRTIERTPEEIAELRAARERFQRDRSTLDDLNAAGSEGPFRHGDLMALLSTIATLKQERERRGQTLADVAERSGLDKGRLSRLENGKILNPTLATLWRYAEAIGARIALSVASVPAETEGSAVS
jgi:DNA-binding phage protein